MKSFYISEAGISDSSQSCIVLFLHIYLFIKQPWWCFLLNPGPSDKSNLKILPVATASHSVDIHNQDWTLSVTIATALIAWGWATPPILPPQLPLQRNFSNPHWNAQGSRGVPVSGAFQQHRALLYRLRNYQATLRATCRNTPAFWSLVRRVLF